MSSNRANRLKRDLCVEQLESRVVLDARLVISEFAASNDQGIQDSDGDQSDWLEIYNAGDVGADLSGWRLTDDVDVLDKWQFLGGRIEPDQYLIVFASGKDRNDPTAELHANFNLRAAGEYLALVEPDGSVASAYSPQYPPQYAGASFGIAPESVPAEGDIANGRYFADPTPGAPNADVSYSGRVENVTVSVARGFYDQPQNVTISTTTSGASIVYTTDGSLPTLENGLTIDPVDANSPPSTELNITSTSTLRVAALKDDHLASDVDTHTYVFVDDVLLQSPNGAAPDGWPTGPVNGQVLDYGMDPDVVNDPEYAPFIRDALLDLPSFSIVTDLEHLFDRSTGFFVNGERARSNGRAWERPTSVELIHPDGTEGFQEDAGIRMRGGFSRRDDNPKHAFRLLFRGEYGAAKLRYPLFGDEGVDVFDNIDLRTAQVPSWSLCFPGSAATDGGCRFNTMVRDVFSRDIHRDMGQPYTRSRYYHLYLNGHYWGLFQTQERPEASYAQSYFGGEKEDYDVIKVESFPHQIEATDGNLDAWRQLWDHAKAGFADDESYLRVQGLNPDGTRNPEYPVLLDVENLADYVVSIFYTGNLDSPISNFLSNRSTNNWFGFRNRNGDEGFRFIIHDAEWTLFDVDENRLGPWPAGDQFSQSNPQWLHQQLMANADYRMRFADRVHRHLFNDGALTPAASHQRIQSRIDQIDLAIIAESARWGDTHRRRPFTKSDWLKEISRITDDHIPARTDIVVSQLRESTLGDGSLAPLYPAIAAPEFNQHGGAIAPGFELSAMAAGDIYYTLDGTDPRLQSPTVNLQPLLSSGADARLFIPENEALGTDWTALGFADESWTAGQTGIGFQRTGNDLEGLIATDIEASMHGNNASAYVRIPFDVDDPNNLDVLRLQIQYDDGFVAYLNGVPVASRNASDNPTWNSTATGSRSSRLAEEIDLSGSLHLLQSGDNMLAIHGLNRSRIGSDFLLLPELHAGTVIETGASTSSVVYSAPIPLSKNTVVKARTFSGGVWSALSEATFVVGRAPLRISEIMYHPRNPSAQEQSEGFTNDDDFEFIEVVNASDTESIDLEGMSFTEGIEFTFPHHELEAGQRAVVARNASAFEQRHGIGVVGQYGGTADDFRLDNRSETIRLVDSLGLEIQSLSYDEAWYPETDGRGYSLEFVGNADDPSVWSVSTSWLPSQVVDGTPGTGRLTPGDANRDGIFNSSDFVQVFRAGEYEDMVASNSTWAEGDWDGDGDFTTRDLVVAFQAGAYVSAARRRELVAIQPLQAADATRIMLRHADARRTTVDHSIREQQRRRIHMIDCCAVDALFESKFAQSSATVKDLHGTGFLASDVEIDLFSIGIDRREPRSREV